MFSGEKLVDIVGDRVVFIFLPMNDTVLIALPYPPA